MAADEGVPVVRQGEGEEAEDGGGVGEGSGGGGAEVEELRAGVVEAEEAGDEEVGVELPEVRERVAFLQDRFHISHRPFEFCSFFSFHLHSPSSSSSSTFFHSLFS